LDSPGSVTRLIHDLRSDDPAVRERAARRIWRRYFRELLALARSHLSRRIRRREDEQDVLQSMYKSFCRRQRRGDFDLAGRDELWRLLVTITLNKARNAAQRHLCAKRDVRREQAAPTPAAGGDSDSSTWTLEQMEAAEPTPAVAALLNEALEQRLLRLADPELHQVALWKLEGCTTLEIAARYQCTEKTIEHQLKRIRVRWASDADSAPEKG
jgi:RNA polymerase sigma factor (sigma-70 family)